MNAQPNAADIQDNQLPETPIVLRFANLFPQDLSRFRMHDKRTGGDLSHVDIGASQQNAVLYGNVDWIDELHDELRSVKQGNLEEHARALRQRSRHSEADRVEQEGGSAPWHKSSKGPLREGILTVNKRWFGGTGQQSWDQDRVAQFEETAMRFLTENFPGTQLRYVSAHADEESYHLHFVVAVWAEKNTKTRGQQFVLQPSANPLLQNYEHAQDLAGAAFEDLGIGRGQQRAQARRIARARGEAIPKKRRHVPPSEWRQEEQKKALIEKKHLLSKAQNDADRTVDEGQQLAKATIKKSRKRAIKEARARKLRAEQQALDAQKRRTAAEAEAKKMNEAADNAVLCRNRALEQVLEMEPKVQSYEARVERAVQRFNSYQAASTREQQRLKSAKGELARVEAQKNIASTQLQAAQVEQIAVKKSNRELKAETARLSNALALAKSRLEKAEALVNAISRGLELLAEGVIGLTNGNTQSKAKLSWGQAEPQTEAEKSAIQTAIRPAHHLLTRLASLINAAVDKVIERERAALKKDAEFVLSLKGDWERNEAERLRQIAESTPQPDQD